ncbi:MAG: hypothetical protein WAV09_03350 [Minisyncoccia bacterium]
MSDENENNGEETALDHFFNALGHLGRAWKKSNAEAAEKRASKPKKLKLAFDEAPAAPKDCCVAKRGE